MAISRQIYTHFEVQGEPVPKERPRWNRSQGTPYTPPRTRAFEKVVATYAMAEKHRYSTPCVVTCWFHTGRKTIDLDNCLKSVLDGLVKGQLLSDDKIVEELHGYIRRVKTNPRTVIRVSALVE